MQIRQSQTSVFFFFNYSVPEAPAGKSVSQSGNRLVYVVSYLAGVNHFSREFQFLVHSVNEFDFHFHICIKERRKNMYEICVLLVCKQCNALFEIICHDIIIIISMCSRISRRCKDYTREQGTTEFPKS